MKRKEKLLVEAFRGYLSSNAKLGLETHDDEEHSHYMWHQWETIDDMFALKAAESPFFENLTQAFFNVHSYKYLDDPSFTIAMDAVMRSQGVPKDHREQAMQFVEDVKKEILNNNIAERDAGWNPNMDEIAEMTRNADKWGGKKSKPHTGGGPAPKEGENKDYNI